MSADEKKKLLIVGGAGLLGIVVLVLLLRGSKAKATVTTTGSEGTLPDVQPLGFTGYPAVTFEIPPIDAESPAYLTYNYPALPSPRSKDVESETAPAGPGCFTACDPCTDKGFGGVASQSLTGAAYQRQIENLTGRGGRSVVESPAPAPRQPSSFADFQLQAAGLPF